MNTHGWAVYSAKDHGVRAACCRAAGWLHSVSSAALGRTTLAPSGRLLLLMAEVAVPWSSICGSRHLFVSGSGETNYTDEQAPRWRQMVCRCNKSLLKNVIKED